jgi:hypothetical protein
LSASVTGELRAREKEIEEKIHSFAVPWISVDEHRYEIATDASAAARAAAGMLFR